MRPADTRRRENMGPAAGEDNLFDYGVVGHYIGYVFRSAARHRLLFVSCFLMVVGAAAALVAVMPRQYQIEASMLTVRNPIMNAFTNPNVNREWDAPLRAAREVVMRRDNLIALCKQTDFVRRHVASRSPLGRARAWLNSALGAQPPSEDEVLDGILDAIETKLYVSVGSEGTVTIGFVWSNAQLAFDFVEAALRSFLEARHTAEISTVRETIGILESHDAGVQKEAIEIAERLEEKERSLRGRTPIRRTLPPPPISTDAPRSEVDDQRLQATLALKERSLMDLEESQRRRVQELQARLAEQLNVFAPGHPLVMETRAALDAARGLSTQIDALRGEVGTLEAESKHRGIGHSSLPLAAMETGLPRSTLADLGLTDDPRLEYERSQLGALLRQHSNLLDRIASARVEIDTAEAAFKYRYSVISPPQMPRGPIRSRFLMIGVAGFLGGLAFAFFSCVVFDIRGGKVIEEWQVERLGLTVLTKERR
jgi:hypothetical protein